MSLTAANATIFFNLPALFPAPFQIQGFSADEVMDAAEVEGAETSMGVDGILSGGYINVPFEQGYTLQADSPSVVFFDQWFYQQKAILDTLNPTAVITMPSLGKQWNMTKGFLLGYKPMPDLKKIAQPQKFRVRWESALPSPITT
jgi:hypothetical protein